MASTPPRQFSLDLTLFPTDDLGVPLPWVQNLITALNQFAVQSAQYFDALNAKSSSRTLTFTTGSSISASFPINVQVATVPAEVRFGSVQMGALDPSTAPSVQWRALAGGKQIQITSITGLLASTQYKLTIVLAS